MKNLKKKVENCIKIPIILNMKIGEKRHVRENVEKESVLLVSYWKKVYGIEKYAEI